MDEQGIDAYLNLIQQLLQCPNGQEIEILQANQELVNWKLVDIMEAVAAQMEEDGDINTANWLRSLAQKLTEVSLEDYVNFLMSLLQAVGTDPSPQSVYPLLQDNLDKLDKNLGQILQLWASKNLSYLQKKEQEEQAEFLAKLIGKFGEFIQHFSLGDIASNIEIAIASYEVFITVFTLEVFPQQWARTQNNIGNAYCDRINGDKADNIEQAITAYQNALPILTQSAFSQEWAIIQNNIGNAYLDRIKGERTDNIEQAIAYYKNALLILTKSAFPQDWARIQNNLALAYFDRIKGDRAGNLEQAIAAFRNALEIYTPENFPLDCLITASNLGGVGLENNNWQLAIESFALAIQIVEQNRALVIDEERRQEIIADSIDVYVNIVQACLNLGEIEKAVEYTERFRGQRLVDMMASNELYQGREIVPELEQHLQDYEELQRRINLLDFGSPSKAVLALARTRNKNISLGMRAKESDQFLTREALLKNENEIKALEAQKQQVWQQLRSYDPVLAGQVQVEHLDCEQMQQLIEESTTALLSFYTTDEDTHIFILRQDRSPQVFTCVRQGWDKLQNWIWNNWLIPYDEAQSEWKQKMGDFLEELAERLQLQELVGHYLTGIKELIIVPYGLLHQIPFAALPIVDPPQPPLIRAGLFHYRVKSCIVKQ